MGWHIDWLTIVQEGVTGGRPYGTEGVYYYDLETGERLSETVTPGAYEGSYSTRATVKYYGDRLSWSGNPARIDRLDNVFGYDLEQSVVRVNASLRSLGVPEFTVACDKAMDAHSDKLMRHQGAKISRIDITRNFATGSPTAAASWTWAAHGSRIQGRKAQPQETGVSWGRRQYRQLVVYQKGPELLAHVRQRAGLSHDEQDYRRDLAAWANESGLLRVELRLGREFLGQTGVAALGMLSHSDLEQIAEDYWSKVRVASSCDMSDVFQVALEEGFTPRRAAQLRDVHWAWYMGGDISVGRSQATMYRLRSDLATIAGIDIFTAPNVTALTKVRREIVLSDPVAPDWYRWGSDKSAA